MCIDKILGGFWFFWTLFSTAVLVYLVFHRVQLYRIVRILLQNPELVQSLGFDRAQWWKISHDYKLLGQLIKSEMLYEFLKSNLPGIYEIRKRIEGRDSDGI